MRRAAIFVFVAACAKLVGIHDYQPNDASGSNAPSPDAAGTMMPPPCGSGWGAAGCVTSLAAGVDKTCAVAGGVVYCWGNLPGDGSFSESSPTAVRAVGSNVIVTTSSTGLPNGVACLDASGIVTCWGDTSLDQQQSSSGSSAPGAALPQPWSSIAVGADHVCGLTGSGAVSCWGADNADQLGNQSIMTKCVPSGSKCSAVPLPIEVGSGVLEIAAGDSHTCARYAGGSVACWGSDGEGQLGNGSAGVAEGVPQKVIIQASVPSAMTRIVAGLEHTCALDVTGQFACWGAGGNGQLGTGSANDAYEAAFSNPTGSLLTAIATGESNTCAIDATGRVWCWGDDEYGVAGTSGFGTDAVVLPASIGITNATLITVGKRHACALLATGGIECWGDNALGELGSATPPAAVACGTGLDTCSPTPFDVPPP